MNRVGVFLFTVGLLVSLAGASSCDGYLGMSPSGSRFEAYDSYCLKSCAACLGLQGCLKESDQYCKNFGTSAGTCSDVIPLAGISGEFCQGSSTASACGFCQQYVKNLSLAACIQRYFSNFCCHSSNGGCTSKPVSLSVCKDFKSRSNPLYEGFCSGTSTDSACGYCVAFDNENFDECMRSYSSGCCRKSTGDCDGKPQPKPTPKPIVTQPTTPSPDGGHIPSVSGKRLVIYLDWKAYNVAQDIRDAVDAGYNTIVLGFFIHLHKNTGTKDTYWDAAQKWMELSASERQSVLDYVHGKGAIIMLSVGGETEDVGRYISANSPTGAEYGRLCAQKALDANLDGLDFDLENLYQNHFAGSGIKWLVDATKEARKLLPRPKIVSHAPQAPYISEGWAPQGGYTKVMAQAGEDVDWLFIQYYNQGAACAYNSFQTIFKDHGCWGRGSEIGTLNKKYNIPYNKLVVGKYLLTSHGSAGWVSASDLHKAICEAEKELGYTGGVGAWMFESGVQEVFDWGRLMAQKC